MEQSGPRKRTVGFWITHVLLFVFIAWGLYLVMMSIIAFASLGEDPYTSQIRERIIQRGMTWLLDAGYRNLTSTFLLLGYGRDLLTGLLSLVLALTIRKAILKDWRKVIISLRLVSTFLVVVYLLTFFMYYVVNRTNHLYPKATFWKGQEGLLFTHLDPGLLASEWLNFIVPSFNSSTALYLAALLWIGSFIIKDNIELQSDLAGVI